MKIKSSKIRWIICISVLISMLVPVVAFASGAGGSQISQTTGTASYKGGVYTNTGTVLFLQSWEPGKKSRDNTPTIEEDFNYNFYVNQPDSGYSAATQTDNVLFIEKMTKESNTINMNNALMKGGSQGQLIYKYKAYPGSAATAYKPGMYQALKDAATARGGSLDWDSYQKVYKDNVWGASMTAARSTFISIYGNEGNVQKAFYDYVNAAPDEEDRFFRVLDLMSQLVSLTGGFDKDGSSNKICIKSFLEGQNGPMADRYVAFIAYPVCRPSTPINGYYSWMTMESWLANYTKWNNPAKFTHTNLGRAYTNGDNSYISAESSKIWEGKYGPGNPPWYTRQNQLDSTYWGIDLINMRGAMYSHNLDTGNSVDLHYAYMPTNYLSTEKKGQMGYTVFTSKGKIRGVTPVNMNHGINANPKQKLVTAPSTDSANIDLTFKCLDTKKGNEVLPPSSPLNPGINAKTQILEFRNKLTSLAAEGKSTQAVIDIKLTRESRKDFKGTFSAYSSGTIIDSPVTVNNIAPNNGKFGAISNTSDTIRITCANWDELQNYLNGSVKLSFVDNNIEITEPMLEIKYIEEAWITFTGAPTPNKFTSISSRLANEGEGVHYFWEKSASRASWVTKKTDQPDEFYYHSSPEARTNAKPWAAEIKDGAPVVGERFEAMAGVPTTEDLYVGFGGSEFITSIEGKYKKQTGVTRKYTLIYGHSGNDWKSNTPCTPPHTHGSDPPSPCSACHMGEHSSVHPGTKIITATVTQPVNEFAFMDIESLDFWRLDDLEYKAPSGFLGNGTQFNKDPGTGFSLFYRPSNYTAGNGRLKFSFAFNDKENEKYGDTTISEPGISGITTDVEKAAVDWFNSQIGGKTVSVDVISDYVIAGTSEGYQVPLYFKYKSNTVTMAAKPFSVGNYNYTAPSITFAKIPDKTEMWTNNTRSAATWTDAAKHITRSGFNGNYKTPLSKWDNPTNTTESTDQSVVDELTQQPNRQSLTKTASYTGGYSNLALTIQGLNILDSTDSNRNWSSSDSLIPVSNGVTDTGSAYMQYTNVVAGWSKAKYPEAYSAPDVWKFKVGYEGKDEELNDIVIHNPVSVEPVVTISNDKKFDLRTASSIAEGGDPPNDNIGCPNNASCEYSTLDCAITVPQNHDASCYSLVEIGKSHVGGLNAHVHDSSCYHYHTSACIGPSTGSWGGGSGYAYTWVATESTTVTFYSTSYSGDPQGKIYVNGSQVAQDDDSGGGWNFRLSAYVSKGQTVGFYIYPYRSKSSACNWAIDGVSMYVCGYSDGQVMCSGTPTPYIKSNYTPGAWINTGYNEYPSGSKGVTRLTAGLQEIPLERLPQRGEICRFGLWGTCLSGSHEFGEFAIKINGIWKTVDEAVSAGELKLLDHDSTHYAGYNYWSTGDSQFRNGGHFADDWIMASVDVKILTDGITGFRAWSSKATDSGDGCRLYVLNGPAVSDGIPPLNAHVCTPACTSTMGKVLTCSNPHHIFPGQPWDYADPKSHYMFGDSRCYKPCGDDSKHNPPTQVVIPGTGTVSTSDTFINLDREFKVYFPNKGNFKGQPNLWGIPVCTAVRGKGYTDEMDTTEWTREKWAKFPFRVIDSNGVGHDFNEPIDMFELNHDGNYVYTFYLPLNNSEYNSATCNYNVVANNAAEVSNYIDNGEVTNKDRAGNFEAMHTAVKEQQIDVIGYIGNLALHDTGDFRFAQLFKTALASGEYLVPNLVKKVDYKVPRTVLVDKVDIRQETPSETTNWHGTYGLTDISTSETTGGKNKKGEQLPLTPALNPIEALKKQPLRPGYNMFMDVETIGNYYVENMDDNLQYYDSNLQQRLVITPKYYALNLKTSKYAPVDVYMGVNGVYKSVVLNNTEQEDTPSEWVYYLDWLEESARRNFTDKERDASIDVKTGLTYTTGSGDPNSVDGPPLNHTLRLPTNVPDRIGTASRLFLNDLNRTFIGSDKTYGVQHNPGGSWPMDGYNRQSQRYHYTLGLPSSSVFLEAGKECTDVNMKELRRDYDVIVCTADIKVKGQVWSLEYNSNGLNSTNFKVLEDGPTYSTPIDPATGAPTNDPVVAIYHISKTAKDDLRTQGTH